MISDPPPKRILVVASSMSIGGPQKSLIGMLDRLDFNRVSVDLLVLTGEIGPLTPWLPEQVRLLPTPVELRAATLPRSDLFASIVKLGRAVRFRRFPSLLWALMRGAAQRGGKQRMRQHVWRAIRDDLPRIQGTYDAAFGILGLSTYTVVDLVEAKFKYHWIRSDTRVLHRDELVDGSYFKELTGAVAVSETCADIFLQMYPFSHGRVFVYKNDIPKSRGAAELPFDPEAAAITLLTVSRLDRLKGIDLAIDACHELIDRGHDVQWIIVGDGAERAALEGRIASRGLAGLFHMVGSVLDTTACLEAATFYVHPSRTEGRSNSVEEARAIGKPIVATAYDTVKDQVEDGVTGLVCGMTASDIASAVEKLIDDPGLAVKIAGGARASYVSEVGDPMRMLTYLAEGRLPELVAD